jgi:hypothetical protein
VLFSELYATREIGDSFVSAIKEIVILCTPLFPQATLRRLKMFFLMVLLALRAKSNQVKGIVLSWNCHYST